MLFDESGLLIARAARPHRQIVNEKGWVEHDPAEIWNNTVAVCADVIAKSSVSASEIAVMGIMNQRETSLMWDRATGRPIHNAVVWQCARAEEICKRREIAENVEKIRHSTGLPLSPYFPAAKLCWLMENVPEAKRLASCGRLACGTVDSWLLFKLTGEHKTDFSNASRTQLFRLAERKWDEELCALFGIPIDSLPEVCMSDSDFEQTNLEGLLPHPIPVRGVLGDSHAALLGQNCRSAGQIKATYGTGSSVMMNIGERPRLSDSGLVTSMAWGLDGKVEYVFEGNLNYTGAVMTWLREQTGLISTDGEATEMAYAANPNDRTYFVPAFTGLGAPYWDSGATALLTGITRTTGCAEIAKACLDCIAYQINDLVDLMRRDSGLSVDTLRVDGCPTASEYLMQFQSDISDVTVQAPNIPELSGLGAALAAGCAAGVYDRNAVFRHIRYQSYHPAMEPERRAALCEGWREAVSKALTRRP